MDTSTAPVRRTHLLRRTGRIIAAGLLGAGLLVTGSQASEIEQAGGATPLIDETKGYDGHCTEADSNGTTFVIDFQELDGNDGRPAETIVRCSPTPDNEPITRTGLEAIHDAGIELSGTTRWGDEPDYLAFVCRIEGRPAADEPLELETGGAGTPTTTYYEPCGDTPPALAYWSYWHADGQGQDWQYSQMGIMGRTVVPGGFEGWSFSLNTHYTGDDNDNPSPRVSPVHPSDVDPEIDADVAQAAAWIARQLEANDYKMPDFSGALGTVDWGLTLDALFALAAAGVAGDVADGLVDTLQDEGWQFIQWSSAAENGGRAKLALAYQVAGLDPTKVDVSQITLASSPHADEDEADLIQVIRDSMQADGRFGTQTNHFGQTLAVLALARTAEGVPVEALEYLESLQCLDEDHPNYGGLGFGTSCGTVDGDAVGFMLQGLLAGGRDLSDESVQLVQVWMENNQGPDGSFTPEWSPTLGNTNSTGLVGQAARALGTAETDEIADKAAGFVSGLMVGCDAEFVDGDDPDTGGGFIRDWTGAIAYSQASYDAAEANGIRQNQTDQWRRASTQAILGLGELPAFGEISLEGIAADTPTIDDCGPEGEAPVVTADPESVTVTEGDDASFTAAATGEPAPTVRWQRFDGDEWADIDGATEATLTLTNVSLDDDGTQVRAVFTNTAGTQPTEPATLTVDAQTDPDVAPQVTSDPSSITVTEGQDATFTAAATGTPVPAVQWQRLDGDEWADIDGATDTTLTLTTVTLDDDGTQVRAVFTNTVGSQPSEAATLTVDAATEAPEVTTDPESVTVTEGDDASFTAAATGEPAPTVQWQRFDGEHWIDIAEANESTLTLTNVSLDDDGTQVRAVFTNTAGTQPSEAATLTVEATQTDLPDEEELSEENRGGIEAPDTAERGSTVTLTGAEAQAGSPVAVWLFSSPVDLGATTVSETGTLVVSIPEDAELGEHRIAVYSLDGTLIGWDDITVVAASDGSDGGGSGGSGDGSPGLTGPGGTLPADRLTGGSEEVTAGALPVTGFSGSPWLWSLALSALVFGGALLALRRRFTRTD